MLSLVVQEAAGTASNASPSAIPPKEPYQVPADFDTAQLGQPDFSSKQMAERSLPAVFLKRWLELRDQVQSSRYDIKNVAALGIVIT